MYYRIKQAKAYCYDADKILENYPILKEKYKFKIHLVKKNYKLKRELYVDIEDFIEFTKDLRESVVLVHPNDELNTDGKEIEVVIYDGYLD